MRPNFFNLEWSGLDEVNAWVDRKVQGGGVRLCVVGQSNQAIISTERAT